MRRPASATFFKYAAFIFLAMSVAFLAGCGEDDGEQPGETVTLEAGQAVDGPFGTKFRAQSDSISEPLDVNIQQTTAPTDEVPLPEGIETRGSAYALSPDRDVVTDPDKPFLVGLPIPEDTDTENLAVAVQLQPYEYEVSWGEDGRPADYEPGREWSFQEAYIAQGTVATTIPRMNTEDPRLLTVVEAPTFRSFDGSETQPMSHSDESFAAVCINFDNASESCGASTRNAAQDELRDIFHKLTDKGFKKPALSRRANVVPQLFNSDLAFGAWVMRLRPCSNVDYGGLYQHGSDRAWTCVDGGGWQSDDEGSTLRHEYFHGTQYGYGPMRENIRQREGFIIEGQAVASEFSLPNLGRDSGRDLRALDVPLKADSDELDDGDLVEYYAQDFWLFASEFLGHQSIGWFQRILREGNQTEDVNTALSDNYEHNLPSVYWEWAKNQAFESQYTDGNAKLNGACVFESRSVEDTEDVTFTKSGGLTQTSMTLDPLTSEVVEYTLEPASEPYVVSLSAEAPNTLRDEWKFYEDRSSPTDACVDRTNPSFLAVPVNDDPVTAYGLISNALYDDSQQFNLTANVLDASVSIDITDPSEGASVPEGQFVNLEADATATEGIDSIVWKTDNPDNYSGAGDIIGRGESASPGLLCPANHTVTATLTGEMGLEASDSVTFTVENQAPSIEFLTEPPTEVGTGDYLLLKADATDVTCEVGPNGNGADQSLIDWSIDGISVGSGQSVTHQVVANAGETISVSAEYTDDEGETATVGPRDIDVTTPPPGGYPPNVIIESPDEGDDIGTYGIFLEGKVLDSEDGRLTGSALQWTVTGPRGDVVTRTGESPDIADGVAEGLFLGNGMTIELSATDSDGNTTTESISVDYIGPG
jgi:hypothetical protein